MVIQMSKRFFMDFQSSEKMLQFSKVRYTKVSQLKFNKECPSTVEFKLSHSNKIFTQVNIGHERKKSIRIVKWLFTIWIDFFQQSTSTPSRKKNQRRLSLIQDAKNLRRP